MKHDLKLLTALIIALGLPVAAYANATLTQAQITEIIKDVKTIDPSKGARAAIMKETLQGDQSVRTGIESRAELLFNDHTITRLGANCHFSFTEGTRNMSLQSGVMLLEVPKGIGGAKIETAAVTAAVTGTTIMIEAGKTYTKLIVLEGECCIWPKNDKQNNQFFKFKHKSCLTQGQEVILRNGSKVIPDPVYVNLKVLEGTSLLVTGNWGTHLNTVLLNNAANGQGPGTYVPTNLAIIGAGTDVTVIQGQAPNSPPPPGGNPPPPPPGGTSNPPPPPNNPPFIPPSKYGPLFTIPNSGNYAITAGSTINTDPLLTLNNVTVYGRVYRGIILDGDPITYFLGPIPGVNASDFESILEDKYGYQLTTDFPNYGVAAFKFTSLELKGTPVIEMSGNGANDLVLISVGNISVAASAAPYDFTSLDLLSLATANGSIKINAGATITGLTGALDLYAGKDVTMNGFIDIPGAAFRVATEGSYIGGGTIDAESVYVAAQNGITENDTITATDLIKLHTNGAFGGSGFLSSPDIDLKSGGLMTLNETGDDTTSDNVNGVVLDMTALSTLTITGNGIDVPTGFTDAEFESPNVDLTLISQDNNNNQGSATLAGNIRVDNLVVTADEAITDNASITSANDIDLTSNYNDVTINGYNAALSFTISGNNITTGSDAELTPSNEAYVPITITSNGNNTVTLDGIINAYSLVVTGYNVTTLSTLETAGIDTQGYIDIYSSNDVTLGGNIRTPSLLVTGIDNGPVPVSVTITGQINSDSTTIDAGIVDVEGPVAADFDGNGSALFQVDTTSSSVPLYDNNDSLQDFYGITGDGSIDAKTIQIDSRGDLILLTGGFGGPIQFITAEGEIPPSITLNGVQINPDGDLTELDLSGATIEIPTGYVNTPSRLSLNTTAGDITIGGNITLGISSGTLLANSFGNIDITANSTFTADTVSLTANQINTEGEDLTIDAKDVTLVVSNVDGDLTQNSDSPGALKFTETTSGSGPIQVGSIKLVLSGSRPSLAVSAASLVVGNLNFSSFPTFKLSLTSANDINGNSSATITGATSLALQVGVMATLGGENSTNNIRYNGSQLFIDDSSLTSFSVNASSIVVNNNFPVLENANQLTLVASGANEDTRGILVNTPLDLPNGKITLTADSGDIDLKSAVTTGNGDFLHITAKDGSITEDNSLTTGTGGAMSLTAGVGNINLNGSLTTGSGGELDLNAKSGDIHVFNDLEIGGGFHAEASGNIIFATPDPTIGGFMSLVAGGSIDMEEDITIAGPLTLSAAKYLHTQDDATILGATAVTLSLSDAAEISEVDLDHGNILLFDALNDEKGFGPIAIDLTQVRLDDSSVTATANSLTLTSPFDEPNISLSLTTNSGDLDLNNSVTVSSFYGSTSGGNLNVNSFLNATSFTGYSYNGDIVINSVMDFGPHELVEPDATVDVSTFYADVTNGNLVINGSVIATSYFDGYASGGILGGGSITSPSVSLAQSGAAALLQTEPDVFTYTKPTNPSQSLTITLSVPDEGSPSLVIVANPLTLSGNINLTDGDITLEGVVNSHDHTVTANNVTGQSLQATTNVTGGDANNLYFTGLTSVTLDNVSLNAAAGTAGHGGTLIASATASPGPSPAPSYVVVNNTLSANGGSAGGNGGKINLTSAADINANDGANIQANGGSGGGNGGSIDLTAQGTIFSLGISANGGDANPTGPAQGGNGGMVDLTTGTDIDVQGAITANGGAANSTSKAAGGDGGTVSITSGGAIIVDNSITATSGANGSGKWTGGNGGTVNLTAQGEITVNGAIQVSSSDLVHNAVSAKGGKINITSHAPTGVAINISDSGQLAALLNQASAGPGGAITFVADKGGSINVSGSVRADAGTINIQNTAATGAQVALNGANLSGDLVKVGALGNNGTLTIGNSRINGDTAIQLYAAGSNGSVVFNGNTYLSGASLKSIAGSTVTVNNGVAVNVTGGKATVYTTTANYTGSGGNASTTGQFTGNTNTTTKPFASRPAF